MKKTNLYLLILVVCMLLGCAKNSENSVQNEDVSETELTQTQEGSDLKTGYEIREGINVTVNLPSDITKVQSLYLW